MYADIWIYAQVQQYTICCVHVIQIEITSSRVGKPIHASLQLVIATRKYRECPTPTISPTR